MKHHALCGAVALAAFWLAACTDPAPVSNPVQGDVTLSGNVLTWTTDIASLSAVRYGSEPGKYDRIAYPSANLELDRVFRTDHRVPLLSAGNGETVYLQVLNRTEGGNIAAGEEVSFTITSRPAKKPVLAWSMIDVGFGDSHLVTMPGTGRKILVDGGERRDWENVDVFLKNAGVTLLDCVIGTHIHADHIGGLVGDSFTLTDGVLGAYEVGTFLDSPTKSVSRQAYDELLATLSARSVPIQVIRAGDTDATNAALDWDPSVRVEVLNAGGGRAFDPNCLDCEGDWLNNDSIVLRLTLDKVSFFIGGDAEAPVERKILGERGTSIESEVLKVHHHGLNDTSDPGFLDAVNPRVGLIPIATYESSSGTLPSGSVLSRLRERNVDVFANDRAEPLGIVLTGDDGHNVTVTTDGESYEIRVVPSASAHWPPSKPGVGALGVED